MKAMLTLSAHRSCEHRTATRSDRHSHFAANHPRDHHECNVGGEDRQTVEYLEQ